MAYNKIKYGSKTLIDLTGDTVTEETLLTGEKAHNKSGKIITGTFLKNYPDSFAVEDALQDSSGNIIVDSSSKKIFGHISYKRQ